MGFQGSGVRRYECRQVNMIGSARENKVHYQHCVACLDWYGVDERIANNNNMQLHEEHGNSDTNSVSGSAEAAACLG